ncbi:RNA polymerase sigma factor [Paenibacillus tritici]|nr:sigma-70 family RNA polymerase sigma factor [Paenibacillus tritici]
MNDTTDDKQWMLLIAQKDSNALELLYDRYERFIYSFAYQIVKDPAAAEDIMQELFLRLWKNAGQIDFGKGKLLTWMFTVTRKLAIDHLRKRDARLPQQSVDFGNLEQVQDLTALTGDVAGLLTAGEEIREALLGLSRDQQQVMDMIYYQGYTQQEVAQLVAIPPGTVKGRVRLAMKQLHKSVRHWARRDHVYE